MSTGACGVQKRAPNCLKLELQVVASCPECVLGIKLGSSARQAHGLNPLIKQNCS